MVRDVGYIGNINVMERLVTVMHELSMASDLNAVMMCARKNVLDLIGGDISAVIFRENGECYYSDGMTSVPGGGCFPLTVFLCGTVMTEDRTIFIEDIDHDAQVPPDIEKPSFITSVAVAPIRFGNRTGAIGVYWRKGVSIDESQIALLQSLADVTGLAIANLSKRIALERGLQDRVQELEDANDSLEAFVHSVSHDLRAPLRSLAAVMQLFLTTLDGKLENQDVVLVSRISNGIDHMVQLIDGLLLFSKLGRKELATTSVSMNEVVREVCNDIMARENHNRHIDFRVDWLPDIQADPVLIKQVWANLIDNAVKYTRKTEGARIEVGAEADSQKVVYFVKDNGAGFSMQYAHRLFQNFQRLHSQQEFPGVGIGLSLVKRIIEKHGGQIWTEAAVNAGATFYFSMARNAK